MKRSQSSRDAEDGLANAMIALIGFAEKDPSCVCEPCLRLRDLARIMGVKAELEPAPFEVRRPHPVHRRPGGR